MSGASRGTRAGITGVWKAPVAATTFSASIGPSEVSTRKPGPPALRSTDVTSTPQRIGALMRFA